MNKFYKPFLALFFLMVVGSSILEGPDIWDVENVTASGPPWGTVLNGPRAVDWRGAGAAYVARTLPCTVQPTLLAGIGNAGANSTSKNSAIASAISAGVPCVIYEPSGTWYFNTATLILATSNTVSQGNITVRGTGPNSTFEIYTGLGAGSSAYYLANNDTNYGGDPRNVANWTAGYAQTTNSITLDSTTNLHVGSQLILDQLDPVLSSLPLTDIMMTGATGANGTYVTQGGSGIGRPAKTLCTWQGAWNSGATYLLARGDTVSSGGNFYQAIADSTNQVPPNASFWVSVVSGCRSQTQTVTVTSISGAGPFTVGITPGLYAPNWNSANVPQAWWSNGLPLTGIGIEELSIDAGALSGKGEVYTQNVSQSWVKHIRGVSTAMYAHVQFYQSNHMTARDSYVYGSGGGPNSYGFQAGYGTADSLFENNITQHVSTGYIVEGGCANVFGYNYAVDNYFTTSGWQQGDVYLHGANCYTLVDGHEGIEYEADDIHTTNFFWTVHRSYLSGFDPGGGNAKTSQTTPFQLYAWTRFGNVTGSVLGGNVNTNPLTVYSNEAPTATTCGSPTTGNVSVFNIGWSAPAGTMYNTLGACPAGFSGNFAINNDLVVAQSLMRWGNYDTVNAAVRFVAGENASGAVTYPGLSNPSTTLPPSYYLDSKPKWWPNSIPWPPIGPDVTGGNIPGVGGHAYHIPAADCYLNKMGGLTNGTSGPLAFPCSYSASGPAASKILMFTPPLVQPANCGSQIANGAWCGFRLSVLSQSYAAGVAVAANWKDIETAQGVYGGFNAFEATIQDITGFNASASCNGSQCVYTLSSIIGGVPLFQVGQQVVVWGMSNTAANTGVSGCTASAVNNATPTVTCPSTFNGTATGGWLADQCGGSPNGRCLLDLVPTHSSYNGNNLASPTYLWQAAWATACCSTTPLDTIFSSEYHSPTCAGGIPLYANSTSYGVNAYVTGVAGSIACGSFNNHFYKNNGTAGTSTGITSFNTSGGTTADGANIIWQDLGTGLVTNANDTSPTITNAVLASGHAAGWEAPWLGSVAAGGGWKAFANAWISHYAGVAWAGQILNNRWGLVVGGERYLFGASTAAQLTGGSTATLRTTWLGALSGVDSYVAGLLTTYSAPFQNMAVGNGCTTFSTVIDDTWVDAEVAEAVSNGFNIGTEGVQTSDMTNNAQGQKCTGNPPPGAGNDWTYTALTYAPSITYYQSQTTQGSCPNIAQGYVSVAGGVNVTWLSGTQFTTGSPWNAAIIYIGGKKFAVSSVGSATTLTLTTSATNTSSTDYFVGALDCQNSQYVTGDLNRWLPFVAAHRVNLIELYAIDAICAEVSGFAAGPTFAECNGTSPTWHQTLVNFASGAISTATSGTVGQSGSVGGSGIK